jgi:hypothetical protein
MKVAQHFSAGLAFFNMSVPDRDDRVSCLSLRNVATCKFSIVPCRDGSYFCDIHPAINCWATIIRSLRDAKPEFRSHALMLTRMCGNDLINLSETTP